MLRYQEIRDLFILLDSTEPSAAAPLLRELNVALKLVNSDWGVVGNSLIEHLKSKYDEDFRSRKAASCFGSLFRYHYDDGPLSGAELADLERLQSVMQYWLRMGKISLPQARMVESIFRRYDIYIEARDIAGSYDGDREEYKEWFLRNFRNTYDDSAIYDITTFRAHNKTYSGRIDALRLDVVEAVSEINSPLLVTRSGFMEALLGRGDPALRQIISSILETPPDELWGESATSEAAYYRLEADIRRQARSQRNIRPA